MQLHLEHIVYILHWLRKGIYYFQSSCVEIYKITREDSGMRARLQHPVIYLHVDKLEAFAAEKFVDG